MKLNKSKNKGKVHPSPSSSSSSSPSSSSQILNHLLPTTILTLISVLSPQDRQTLAYMLTHSLNSSPPCFHPSQTKNSNRNHKTQKTTHSSLSSPPCFDCCCFDCFSTFWNRWNSSPHRQLIDQAIEAFEEHLAADVDFKREKTVSADVEGRDSCGSPVVKEEESGAAGDVEEREDEAEEVRESGAHIEGKKLQQQQQQRQQHKGLARKVLPDVIGLFNSRLWNLWGPNV